MTVYCRERYTASANHVDSSSRPSSGHVESSYRGVRLQYLPTIRHKYFETVAHTFLSTLHLITTGRYDAVLYCNAANAIFTWMPRRLAVRGGMPVALNVDGLERNRKKWNGLAKGWYRMSEWLATWMPNAVVTDAQSIADYYRERYGRESRMIPYGADIGRLETSGVLNQLGLERRSYFLYVSRMEPENNALLVREAFERVEAPEVSGRVDTTMKLALIGDAPYAADYIARVRDTRDSRVVMPGAIYGAGYRELGSHCFAYIHATEVGGTHPALIEAMGRGALTLYLDTPENREVAGGAAIPFDGDSLAAVMKTVLLMPESEREEWRARAMERVRSRYSWDAVTDAYEKLLMGLARGKRSGDQRERGETRRQ